MANLFNNLKPKSTPQKNGFDLSERHTYSARAGALYPVMCKEVVPGDYFEIDVAALSRTNTLVAPAFARVKQFHHFFFVPYNALWSRFDEFYTQRLDPIHAGESRLPIYAPTFFFPDVVDGYHDNVTNTCSPSDRYISDMLGYGDLDNQGINSIQDQEWWSAKNTLRMNPFRILAYNKIWNDYYRNHYVTESLDPKYFNVNDIPCLTEATSRMESYRTQAELTRMFRMKYRSWKKDIFMGSMPTMQFGDVSVLSTNFDLQIINNATNVTNADNAAISISQGLNKLGLRNTNGYVSGSVSWKAMVPQLFDVLALRKAEKLQEWKQKTLMAGNRSGNNYDAHFGVHPYRENEHAQFIGGFDGLVQINEVTSTTGYNGQSGASNQLGDLAGKGLGATSGKKVKFKSNDFGLIMCIVSFVPELEYNGDYIDKNNTLYEQFDWYTPEFANLGLDPVTFGQLAMTQETAGVRNEDYNQILGYCPSYWWLKSSVDRCHLETATGGSRQAFSTPRRDLYYGTAPLNEDAYYINPAVLDPIFGVSIDNAISTDQFICVSNFDIKAIRPMSVLGLPSF